MTSFNQTQQTVFALLGASLWGHPFTPSPDTDWAAVWKELREQTVDGLCTDVLIQADPARKNAYFQSITKKISFWYTIMGAQQDLCSLMEAHGIPCAVIKGAAAAMYYPQPTYRTMGDVDLILKPDDFDRAYDLMLAHGYKDLNIENPRVGILRGHGIEVDLHRHFSIFKEEDTSQLLDARIYKAIERTQALSLEGFSCPVLPPLENGIILLTHISHHLEYGLGLRQIVDWMLFVDRQLSDSWWESDFAPLVRELGLETLAITVTRMCQIYLGLRSDLTWCQKGNPTLCRDVMSHIMEHGNFGYKKGTAQTKSINILNSAVSDIPGFFRWLQKRGAESWPACQAHPWLRPVAWTYQVGHLARKGFQRSNPLRSLASDIRKSKHHDDFLDQLGVLRYGLRNPSSKKTEEDA